VSPNGSPRTLRAELTDRMLIFSQRHLRVVLTEYVRHYNGRRPNRARDLRPPRPTHPVADHSHERITRRPVLGGLINEYERAAWNHCSTQLADFWNPPGCVSPGEAALGHGDIDAQALAGKHKSTVAKMARKYKASIDTPDGSRTCFQVTVHREQGKKPLVACFGGIPLTRKRTAVLTDLKPIMATVKRNELIRRLVAGGVNCARQG
jgi:hypothetical protein